jgi:hypothetical protein
MRKLERSRALRVLGRSNQAVNAELGSMVEHVMHTRTADRSRPGAVHVEHAFALRRLT